MKLEVQRNTVQDEEEGFSMWSRPFTFGDNKVRVEEEWGLGIGSQRCSLPTHSITLPFLHPESH